MSIDLGDLAARYRAACAALGLPVWRPGMRAVAIRGGELDPVVARVPDDIRGWAAYPGAEPDFTDPATVGCLLAAAREGTGYHGLYAAWHGMTPEGGGPIPPATRRLWRIWMDGGPTNYGFTEADVLVSEMEFAARRKA